MNKKFGLTFAAPSALAPISFEIPQPHAHLATAKPNFTGARPSFLLTQSLEIPTFFNKNN